MKKDELIEALEDSHQDLVELLEPLTESILLEPDVCGNWSIRDILAHLTHWEGQIITLLFQARSGMPRPTTVHFGKESDDVVNQRWHEQSKERSLDMIWQDFTGIRKQTIRRVSAFTDQELNDPNLYPWLGGVPLVGWILNGTIEHDEEHGNQIRVWLDQNEAGDGQRASGDNGHG